MNAVAKRGLQASQQATLEQEQRMLPIRRLEGEQWLNRRLLKHGVDALGGVTDSTDSRKERFRAAIRENQLQLVVCAADGGKRPVLYAEAFERLYGERL